MHVVDAEEKMFAVNVDAPPVHAELNVTDWPLSILGFEGRSVGVSNGLLTMIVVVDEVVDEVVEEVVDIVVEPAVMGIACVDAFSLIVAVTGATMEAPAFGVDE